MTTPGQKLVSQLQTFNTYKNMDEKQIRKTIGKKYDLQRARNSELETELNDLKKPKKKKAKKEIKEPTQSKEKTILVDDTLREILLRSDVETIEQYCLTTKDANKLCNDQYFWHDKLLLEGLPSFIHYDLKNINNHYSDLFKTKNKLIILYQLMITANKDARKILMINDIEKHRQYKPTIGVISTNDGEIIQVKTFNVLPEKAVKKLNKFGDDEICVIEIHYKKDQYQLYLYSCSDVSQNISHYKITYHEALNILTVLLFEKYVDINPDLILVNSNMTQFYDDTDFKGGDVDMLMMQTYYETLNALEKKNGLKI